MFEGISLGAWRTSLREAWDQRLGRTRNAIKPKPVRRFMLSGADSGMACKSGTPAERCRPFVKIPGQGWTRCNSGSKANETWPAVALVHGVCSNPTFIGLDLWHLSPFTPRWTDIFERFHDFWTSPKPWRWRRRIRESQNLSKRTKAGWEFPKEVAKSLANGISKQIQIRKINSAEPRRPQNNK